MSAVWNVKKSGWKKLSTTWVGRGRWMEKQGWNFGTLLVNMPVRYNKNKKNYQIHSWKENGDGKCYMLIYIFPFYVI